MSIPKHIFASIPIIALALMSIGVSSCRADAEAHPSQNSPLPDSDPVQFSPPTQLNIPTNTEETTPHEPKPKQEVIKPPQLQSTVYHWLAVEAARDELYAVIGASSPDTWTCRKKQKEIPEYDDLELKQQRRFDRWWYGSPKLRDRFGYDLKYWRKMMPLYTYKGVCNLRNFVLNGLTDITFLGVDVRVNAVIAPLLKRAEHNMIAKGIHTAPFELVGGFHPRTTRGPFGEGKHLSRHGLGIAIDFDWALNPYFSRRELKFVEEVTGAKFKRSATIPAGKRWDNFKELNTLWLERIGPWLEDKQAEIAELEKTLRGRRSRKYKLLKFSYNFATTNRNVSRAIDNGFLSLPRDFVVEMENVGLIWATDFAGGPDIMHFEYREYKGNPRYQYQRKPAKKGQWRKNLANKNKQKPKLKPKYKPKPKQKNKPKPKP